MSQEAIAAGAGAKVVSYRPRDPAGLGRVVVWAIGVHLALTVVVILIEVFHLSVLSRFDPKMADPNGSFLPGEELPSLLEAVGALLQMLTYAVCAFLSLKWVYRMSLNAHAMASGMSMTPGWNVGWFFVPIAFLWQPIKGLRESWAVSADPANWKSVKLPPILAWWWAAWLVSNLGGNLAFRLALQSGTVSAAIGSDVAFIFSDVLDVPTDLLFILVVRRLTALQAQTLASHSFA